ncbi:hypothetical protein KIN20_016104 [Parelaphostrongylus tenuis]|uniref:Uncharacterized protein n=1 Tax=Parelaphostrongylus tenuis TaxID=148309 RepID=A0AAD5MZD7_PARTN|nr:hypothetical protein KIN20_016104 [Parelaphostrongylus tenuis]
MPIELTTSIISTSPLPTFLKDMKIKTKVVFLVSLRVLPMINEITRYTNVECILRKKQRLIAHCDVVVFANPDEHVNTIHVRENPSEDT